LLRRHRRRLTRWRATAAEFGKGVLGSVLSSFARDMLGVGQLRRRAQSRLNAHDPSDDPRRDPLDDPLWVNTSTSIVARSVVEMDTSFVTRPLTFPADQLLHR
jgi:hypothetical protein